jgi:serine/threonine protein kinase
MSLKHKKQLLNDYMITEQIGSGSFGEVYLAEYKSGGFVAIKVEDKRKSNRIYNEYKIYKYLHKHDFNIGLPKIYDYIQTPDYNIMVMQLLGPSLEDMFNKYKRKFKLSTIFLIAEQLIQLMEQLHNAEYIHRDIKPNNFLVGRSKNNFQIYIMDFGLSKKYIIDGQHIAFKDHRSLIGTARYASINMHMGFEPSRRDELESIGYMLVYLSKGVLPWQGIKKQRGYNHIEKIGEKKMCINLDVLCDGLPPCFKEYIAYCKKLKFDEKPDYNHMKVLFRDTATKMNIKPELEWYEGSTNTSKSHYYEHLH